MDKLDTFYIDELQAKDAISLQQLMVSNKSHFGNYLPVTLAQNETLALSEAYIIKKAEENKANICITFAIKDKTTNNVAGLVIIKNIDLIKKQGEFAYGIGKEFEGRGWTSQSIRKMSQFAQDSLGLKTMQIITHKTNIGSCRVAEKNGFNWQRTLKKEFTPTLGSPVDMELYELNL